MATKRPRTARREFERDVKKAIAAKEKLAALGEGGSPGRPFVVPSASVVEVHAKGIPCLRCGGEVRVKDHAARTVEGRPLRVATIACATCGGARDLYFEIRSVLN